MEEVEVEEENEVGISPFLLRGINKGVIISVVDLELEEDEASGDSKGVG